MPSKSSENNSRNKANAAVGNFARGSDVVNQIGGRPSRSQPANESGYSRSGFSDRGCPANHAARGPGTGRESQIALLRPGFAATGLRRWEGCSLFLALPALPINRNLDTPPTGHILPQGGQLPPWIPPDNSARLRLQTGRECSSNPALSGPALTSQS